MTADELLARLEGVRPCGKGWTACCPAHEDRHASLSVGAGEGDRILLKCFAGCEAESIVRAMGLTMADLMPEREETRVRHSLKRIVATYPYRNERGELLYEVVRYVPKGFAQRRPDGNGGWLWNLNGTRRALYRLADLLAAEGRRVFLVEGEKDADRLAALDLIATTNAGGASKWATGLSESLRGRHVIVVPDNDEPGRRHAETITRSLSGIAASIRVLELPGLPPKGDVSDWLDAGGTAGELKRLAKTAPDAADWLGSRERNGDRPEREPEGTTRPSAGIVCIADVQPETATWLWDQRIPFGKLTLIDGDPGLGKSTLALEIAARLTRGLALPDSGPLETSSVVILSAEDGLADTIRPRLEAAGADLSRVFALQAVTTEKGNEEFPCLRHVAEIEDTVSRHEARLLVVDPLMAYLGGETNSYRDQDVRRALAPIVAMAERTGTAVLVIRHLTKNGGANAVYRGGGSIGISGAARSVLLVAKDPEDEDRRIIASAKSNLSRPPDSLAYRLRTVGEVARVEFEAGSVALTANQLLAAQDQPEDGGALGEAEAFLRDLLAGGAVPSTEVFKAAKGAAIAEITVRRAKTRLRIRPRKVGFSDRWLWELPAEGDHERAKVITPKSDHLGEDVDHLRDEDDEVAL